MKKMQAAMEKGYRLATKSWGQDLPGISKDTLDAANQLFDDYYKSKGVSEEFDTQLMPCIMKVSWIAEAVKWVVET